jgi:hypothetical protein
VPTYITTEFLWLDSGVIVQSRDPQHRVVFIECESLDHLYTGIGEIIGTPIEPIVVESRRRGARDYVARFISDETRERIRKREISLEPIVASQLDSSLIMGFGRAVLQTLRAGGDPDDLVEIRITNPFSVPLWCGSIAGACEAIVGDEWGVAWRELSPDTIEISAFRSEHPQAMKGMALRREYIYQQGDVELERCAACGGPAVLAAFRWQPERGIIGSAYTDRRVSINGETGLQEVFIELEKELGDAVPPVVIEAQRRFVRSGFYSIEGLLTEADFRAQFAFRGLGNLSEFRMGATGLHIRLENPTLHLTVIGFAQALYELAFSVESRVEWEVRAGGELCVEVTPI